MPRKSRIDAHGALHHIIVRGIERKTIFKGDADRNNFLERLKNILADSHTSCFAWALIPNHFHLLLRTGRDSISTVMKRLLTGHTMYFNGNHNRVGHLFQNRYKSILWQDTDYVFKLFDSRLSSARKLNREYAKKGILMGKRPDLIGGGLVRSSGGWDALKGLRKIKAYMRR